MQRLLISLLCLLPLSAAVRGQDRPIPQDPKLQQQRFRDRLAYERRTLVGAYDRVGKKNPRWDKPARGALEAAARVFSFDPAGTIGEIFTSAKQAIDAGCDDPLVLYVYARSINGPPAEKERRYAAAAIALERSDYPPIRRVVVLGNAAYVMLARKNLSAKERQDATRMLDAAAGLLPKAAETYGKSIDSDQHWLKQCMATVERYRMLTGDHESACKRVDAELAKAPALKPLRLLVKAKFLILFAWEARGSGYANTVSKDGSQKFQARLTEARKALEEVWKLKPGDREAPTLMITVETGIGGDRKTMEMWFERAMKADPNNLDACRAKMDWVDPKWHGSVEDMLVFGPACAATQNWRANITLQAVDAHGRTAFRMAKEDDRRKYFRQPQVTKEIQAVCEDYLKHRPTSLEVRSLYAGFAYQCGRYAEADKQFKAMGDQLVGNGYYTLDQMKQIRDLVASQAPKPEK